MNDWKNDCEWMIKQINKWVNEWFTYNYTMFDNLL